MLGEVAVFGVDLAHAVDDFVNGGGGGTSADFIQEFDPDRWQMPKDDKAPFIESIEVIVQESGPSIADSERGKKTVH